MKSKDKIFLYFLVMNICGMIQWNAHYIKGSPLGIDTIGIILIGFVTIILATKE